MININFRKIYEICIKYPIGLDQMSYIYSELIKQMTDDNQNDILDYIAHLSALGLNADKVIEEVKESLDIK